jgi:hypothetical protein
MTKREKTWFFPLCGYQPKINSLIFLVYFSGDSGRTRSAQISAAHAPLFLYRARRYTYNKTTIEPP